MICNIFTVNIESSCMRDCTMTICGSALISSAVFNPRAVQRQRRQYVIVTRSDAAWPSFPTLCYNCPDIERSYWIVYKNNATPKRFDISLRDVFFQLLLLLLLFSFQKALNDTSKINIFLKHEKDISNCFDVKIFTRIGFYINWIISYTFFLLYVIKKNKLLCF